MELKTLAEYNGLEGIGIHVKFTKPEFLESLLDGNLFMNNFKCFIDLENKTKIKGQGDKLEAGFVFRGNNAKVYYQGKEIGSANNVETVERYTEAEKLPVFCYARFESKDLVVIEENENDLKIKVCITKEDQEAFIKDFGPVAVVLPGDFENRVTKVCNEEGIEAAVGKVAYLDYNHHNNQRRKTFEEGSLEMFFWKDDYFKYQRECRILLTDTFVDQSMTLNIGNLRDKSHVMETVDFFEDAVFDISFEDLEDILK